MCYGPHQHAVAYTPITSCVAHCDSDRAQYNTQALLLPNFNRYWDADSNVQPQSQMKCRHTAN